MDQPDAHSPALARLADRLRALPPSCGPVRLVAVDGHAGSGKSTFAVRLSAALGGAPVVRLDDLATHEELFGWTGRLREQVLEPLGRGAAARYGVYDWTAARFASSAAVPCAPVVLIEGGIATVRDSMTSGAAGRGPRPITSRPIRLVLSPICWYCRGLMDMRYSRGRCVDRERPCSLRTVTTRGR
jgi:hypothetical protein